LKENVSKDERDNESYKQRDHEWDLRGHPDFCYPLFFEFCKFFINVEFLWHVHEFSFPILNFFQWPDEFLFCFLNRDDITEEAVRELNVPLGDIVEEKADWYEEEQDCCVCKDDP